MVHPLGQQFNSQVNQHGAKHELRDVKNHRCANKQGDTKEQSNQNANEAFAPAQHMVQGGKTYILKSNQAASHTGCYVAHTRNRQFPIQIDIFFDDQLHTTGIQQQPDHTDQGNGDQCGNLIEQRTPIHLREKGWT